MTSIDQLMVGSLFSGIGGIELGLERTGGFETKWFCENNPYAQAVLRKHWPSIPCYPDVRELGVSIIPERVDVICGGFPCQDVSSANIKGRTGLDGERTGLFFEMSRLVDQIRPRYWIMENVSNLINGGLERVLREIASIRYDAEWEIIQANWFGLPHRRARVFIVAYSQGQHGQNQDIQDALHNESIEPRIWRHPPSLCADTIGHPLELLGSDCGTDDGISDEVDRLRCLGNAVVPQVAEYVGRCILEYERRRDVPE